MLSFVTINTPFSFYKVDVYTAITPLIRHYAYSIAREEQRWNTDGTPLEQGWNMVMILFRKAFL